MTEEKFTILFESQFSVGGNELVFQVKVRLRVRRAQREEEVEEEEEGGGVAVAESRGEEGGLERLCRALIALLAPFHCF